VAPLIEKWKPVSVRHKYQLANVAIGADCQQIENVYYYTEALDIGKFGLVFIGISVNDGKEAAVKRIAQMKLERGSDTNENEHLSLKVDCNEVVRLLSFTEDNDFLYVFLELMEGNLDDLLADQHTFDRNQEVKLCEDILKGLEYLHRQGIIHRGVKPSNILYCGVFPTLCLKLAFFGLRCQMTEQCSSTFTDTYETLTNARCWMAPEVLQSQSDHSKSSDIFSCGLVIHYLVSVKKNPFAPTVCSKESPLAVSIETVDNIIHNQIGLDENISTEAKMMLDKDQINFAPVDSTTKYSDKILHDTETNVLNKKKLKLDDSLSPEATHLVQLMLDSNVSNRPTAAEALVHPFFWSNETKKVFLHVVGNEPEVAMEIQHPLTAFGTELEERFSTIVTRDNEWNGLPSYNKIAATYAEMKIKRKYDYGSVAGLIRFIRNAYQHINEQPANIKILWENDFVFSDYFPHLVIEIYKVLTTSKLHNLHKSRKAIKKFLSKL
jgi:serine/threonine protein kinase